MDVDLVCATVVATPRQVAEQVTEPSDRDAFLDVAKQVEFGPDAWLRCPVCEETTCDEGCPLEEARRLADAPGQPGS